MSRDSTVLLVEARALPQGLETSLQSEGCRVESIDVTQISGTLLVSAPAAIVAPGKHADEISRAIRSAASNLDLPFLALVDVHEIPKMRARVSREVTALVADSVSAQALAIRVHATIQQSATKKARPRTLMGVAGLSSIPKLTPSTKEDDTTEEFVFTPDDEPKTAVQVMSLADAEDTEPAQFLAGDAEVTQESRLEDIKSDEPEDEADTTHITRAEISRLAAKSKKPGAVAPPPPPSWEQPPAGSTRQAHASPEAKRGAPEPPVPSAGPDFPLPSNSAPARSRSDSAVQHWKDLRNPAASPPSSNREASIQIGLPAAEILKLRIAIIDDDVTRADALGRALRLEGQDVFLSSSRRTDARWSLLRGFAPQVLIMDLSKGDHGTPEITLALAKDPFLRDTPIVRHSFASLFDDRTGKADVRALDVKLSILGRAELELTAHLRAGEAVTVARGQVNPARLLALLAELGKSSVITAKTEDEVMHWEVVAGKAGIAELRTAGSMANLTAKQALDHLLHRPHAQVVVEPRRDIHLARGEVVEELLDSAYQDYLPDVPSSLPSSPSSLTPVATDFWPAPGGSQAHTAASAHEGDPGSLPRPRGRTVPTFDEAFPSGTVESRPVAAATRRHRPLLRVAGAVGLFGLGAMTAFVAGRTASSSPPLQSSSQPTAQKQARPQEKPLPATPDDAAKTKATPASVDGPEDPSSPAFFKVDGAVTRKSCEDLLGKTKQSYAGSPRWKGAHYLKLARQSLMQGDKDKAESRLCLSSFIDEKGGGPTGLATFYLGERALDQARSWAQTGIDARPDNSRQEKELLGDALNQLGQIDEAKALWLETLKLDEKDTDQLRKVIRTLEKSAQSAIDGGALHIAERLLRRAATFDPDRSETASLLAYVLLKNDQNALAERWARHALRLDEESAEAHYVLGELSLESGDGAEAKSHLEKVAATKTKLSRQAKERLSKM